MNQPEIKIEKLDRYRYLVPKNGPMRTDALIYASDETIGKIVDDNAALQAANVACLPGIVGRSLAMPDAHWGYGFPIGGVAAFDLDEGVISPGGVGYDINCGVRLVSTGLEAGEIKAELRTLLPSLFNALPSGVGTKGFVHLQRRDAEKLLVEGVKRLVGQGFASPRDLENIEGGGCLPVETLAGVSERAFERAGDQLGTLGAGNHFIELQEVDEIFDPETAAAFGLVPGGLAIMIHSGSRGFGYQVCDDSLKSFAKFAARTGLELPDRQLACAPISSKEGREYYSAMNAAANYAFANRQHLMDQLFTAFERHFKASRDKMGLRLVYDVAHNVAKVENHTIEGKYRKVLVHRKGATRSFGPGHPEIPAHYRRHGQPVLVPGDMGRASYVLAGVSSAEEASFGSACHGAGRQLSRNAALKAKTGRQVFDELEAKGIRIMTGSLKGLAEEMPEAYKNVHQVVDACVGAGLAAKVARLTPLAVIKG